MAELDLQQLMADNARERSTITKALLSIQQSLDKIELAVSRMEPVVNGTTASLAPAVSIPDASLDIAIDEAAPHITSPPTVEEALEVALPATGSSSTMALTRCSTECPVHDDDWVQPMPALSNFSLTRASPSVVYLDPDGPLLHLTPTAQTGHAIHLVVESMDLFLPPWRKGIEHQPWPPPTQVQIVETDAVLLHGIAHGCVAGDSGYVWWPPDKQPRMRSELQEWGCSRDFIICAATCSASGMAGLEPTSFAIYSEPLLSSSPDTTHVGFLYTSADVTTLMLQVIVFDGQDYMFTHFVQHFLFQLQSQVLRPRPWPSFECHLESAYLYAALGSFWFVFCPTGEPWRCWQYEHLQQGRPPDQASSWACMPDRSFPQGQTLMAFLHPWPPLTYLIMGKLSGHPSSIAENDMCNHDTMWFTDTSVYWQFFRKEEFKGSGNYSSVSMAVAGKEVLIIRLLTNIDCRSTTILQGQQGFDPFAVCEPPCVYLVAIMLAGTCFKFLEVQVQWDPGGFLPAAATRSEHNNRDRLLKLALHHPAGGVLGGLWRKRMEVMGRLHM